MVTMEQRISLIYFGLLFTPCAGANMLSVPLTSKPTSGRFLLFTKEY